MCINLECPIGCGAELPRYDVTFDLRVKLSDHTGSLDNIRLSGATAERVIGCTVRRSVTLFTILYTYIKLTLCRSYLKPYCMGRKAAFFQQAFKFTYYTRNRSPLQEKKIITIKLKKTE